MNWVCGRRIPEQQISLSLVWTVDSCNFCFFYWTEIRNQLVEQFKCLEQQSESRIQLLQDLQEFFRRKAETELEYSRSLEKLAERFSSKIRSSKEHQQFKWVSLPTDAPCTPTFVLEYLRGFMLMAIHVWIIFMFAFPNVWSFKSIALY